LSRWVVGRCQSFCKERLTTENQLEQRHDVASQAWPKLYRFDHRTGDAHAIPALGRFPSVVREAQPRLVRVSQLIPQARSLGLSIFSPSCTGDDGGVNDASERRSDAARGIRVALNWRQRFLGKGHDAGIRRRDSESGRNRGMTPAKICPLPPNLSTPTPVLTRATRLSRR